MKVQEAKAGAFSEGLRAKAGAFVYGAGKLFSRLLGLSI
jgi:hypothetical protein